MAYAVKNIANLDMKVECHKICLPLTIFFKSVGLKFNLFSYDIYGRIQITSFVILHWI